MRDSIRYLRIVDWARHRYTADGRLLHKVFGIPSRFSRIEDMAAAKYMDLTEHFPGRPLCACPASTTTSKGKPTHV